jgi:probable H4MPT-linked C1 transfer pathway protein
MILGLDIGGANTKAASSDGNFVQSVYLPLWSGAPLDKYLKELAEKKDPQSVGVVMTGELADCFSDKVAGIIHIKDAVMRAFDCPVFFWGALGFDSENLRLLAGANWSASANFLAEEVESCIFVDMGSTTTDLIPIKGKPKAAFTDYQRLIRGELIYSGMLRTSIGALLHSVKIDGHRVPLSSEMFAITADANLALKEITEEEYTCDTPDGAGKDRQSALRRLARSVCADLEELGANGAIEIARQANLRQEHRLRHQLKRQASEHDLHEVVAAGIGEEMIKRSASQLGLGCTRLSDLYGKRISGVFPAYAVARLVELRPAIPVQ